MNSFILVHNLWMSSVAEKIFLYGSRLFLAVAIFIPLLWVTPATALKSYILLGQAHFLSTYWYKFKANEFSKNGVALFAFVTLCLFSLYWTFPQPNFLLVSTIFLFLIHFWSDEFFLLKVTRNWPRMIEAAPNIFLPTGLMMLRFNWASCQIPLALGFFCLGLSVVGLLTKYFRLEAFGVYARLGSLFWIWLILFGQRIPMPTIYSWIVIIHYAIWYVAIAWKRKNDFKGLRNYFLEMIAILFFTLAVYVLGLYVPYGNVVNWTFFNFDNFFLWTLMHLATSIRFRKSALA